VGWRAEISTVRPAVWAEDGSGWHLVDPVGFGDEESLHDLVEANPGLLPLAGAPQLAVLGREVPLGSGRADLMAVEATGRLVLVEVKLARNAEARRAIVAQVLAYAAYLRGITREELDFRLRPYLSSRGMTSVDDVGSLLAADAGAFRDSLDESLATGRFRLVLVLDAAPEELVRLVGYLEAIGDQLTIDLVQVSAYEIGGQRVLVPQRMDDERAEPSSRGGGARVGAGTEYSRGPDLFDGSIDGLSGPAKVDFERYRTWAGSLESEGVASLQSSRGTSFSTLRVLLRDEDVGPVAVFNDGKAVYLGLFRQVLERRCPSCLDAVEAAALPAAVGRGTSVRDASDELLAALAYAYRDSVQGEQSGGTVP
jgi:hypothetical protein